MELTTLCSPAYKLNTVNSACSRQVNVYLESVEKGSRAGKLRLRGIPGMKRFTQIPDSPVRALLAIDSGNRLFAVAGATVFEIFADGTFQAATGNIALSSHPAIMVTNGFQLAIASGGLLYIVNGQTGGGATVFPATFTDGSPVLAGTVTFLDQYFIIDQINSKELFISNLAPDGATWDPADTAFKEGYPDNIARVFADNEQLWIFGFDTTEVFADTGATFPFERIQGAVLNVGCSAPFSVAGALGHRFWLWRGVVYSAYGLDPQRVSDFGVEEAIQTYGDTSDAEGFCQVVGGHLFYFLHFPAAGKTWVFDKLIGAWHERASWAAGKFTQYRGRVYAQAFGKQIVGDIASGDLWELDEKTYTDANAAPLRREVISPYLTEDMRMLRFNQLTVDMDTGVGLDVAENQLGYDPQIILRYSKNRGKSYSNERSASMGQVGKIDQRVIFNQLGSSRIGMAFDLVVTDPVQLTINTAFLKVGEPEVGR